MLVTVIATGYDLKAKDTIEDFSNNYLEKQAVNKFQLLMKVLK